MNFMLKLIPTEMVMFIFEINSIEVSLFIGKEFGTVFSI